MDFVPAFSAVRPRIIKSALALFMAYSLVSLILNNVLVK